jgi:hypothetical protein
MFRYFLVGLLFVFFNGDSNAQVNSNETTKPIIFPKSFIGNWKGTLNWYKLGNKEPQTVAMELRIQPAKDSAGQYTWNLIYGSPSKDNRPYILKPIDTAKGHWVIDELNTIVIDQFWIANKFCGSFAVGGNTIVNNYWLEGDKLMIEFLSHTTKSLTVTGKGTDEIPLVDSYEVKSYQKAELMRAR